MCKISQHDKICSVVCACGTDNGRHPGPGDNSMVNLLSRAFATEEFTRCSHQYTFVVLVQPCLFVVVQSRDSKSQDSPAVTADSFLWRNKFRLVTPQNPPLTAEAISKCAASSRSFLLGSIRTQLLRFTRVRLVTFSHMQLKLTPASFVLPPAPWTGCLRYRHMLARRQVLPMQRQRTCSQSLPQR